MLPSPACPKHGIRRPYFALRPIDQLEELRDAPFGTTTSWLILIGAIVLSAIESSRRDAPQLLRAPPRRAREDLGRAGVAARLLDPRKLPPRQPRRRRRPRAAAGRRCLPARASGRRDSAHRFERSPSISSRAAGTTRRAISWSPLDRRLDVGNVARSVACTGGFGTSRRMTRVMIASVPSEPTRSCVRS